MAGGGGALWGTQTSQGEGEREGLTVWVPWVWGRGGRGGGKSKADSQTSPAEEHRGESRFKMSSEEHEKLLLSVAFLFPFHLVWTREAAVQ